jgi:hypothetical protein
VFVESLLVQNCNQLAPPTNQQRLPDTLTQRNCIHVGHCFDTITTSTYIPGQNIEQKFKTKIILKNCSKEEKKGSEQQLNQM